jgi:flavin reductase (DIM6/NTAB) family NADH-FMN oxidoreductase RutF
MWIQTDPKKISENTFRLIGDEWMLVTAGTSSAYNTMTASWGGFGVLWHKNVATVYIRPQRHTLPFIGKNDFFTLSFFNQEHKDILRFCGAHSGKNTDKVTSTGLRPAFYNEQAIYFEQAKMALVCKKLFMAQMEPGHFTDQSIIDEIYPQNDFHFMVIGEIAACLKQQ